MNVYEKLDKLDRFLGLPPGVSRSVIANCNPTHVGVLNEKLAAYGLIVDESTSVPKEQRGCWKALVQEAGVSRAWWLDGDPNVAELPSDVKII